MLKYPHHLIHRHTHKEREREREREEREREREQEREKEKERERKRLPDKPSAGRSKNHKICLRHPCIFIHCNEN